MDAYWPLLSPTTEKGIQELIDSFVAADPRAGFLSIVIALCYWATVYGLEFVGTTALLTPSVRGLLADYAFPVSHPRGWYPCRTIADLMILDCYNFLDRLCAYPEQSAQGYYRTPFSAHDYRFPHHNRPKLAGRLLEPRSQVDLCGSAHRNFAHHVVLLRPCQCEPVSISILFCSPFTSSLER